MNSTNLLTEKASAIAKPLAGLLVFCFIAAARGQVSGETLLHQFNPAGHDGASPYSGVIVGNDGVLYGTTWDGGTNAQGTVFRMNQDGSGYVILHHFGAVSDGSSPFAALLQANDGRLYGTTYYGGTNANGTLFSISTNGTAYSVLYCFTNLPDGAHPYAGLIQGLDGALYGTTYGGGSNQGTVFKINLDGTGYSRLHTFTNFGDATLPFGNLAQAPNGKLYGTTFSGGAGLVGTVFTIDTNGNAYSVLHNFNGVTDGQSPESGLLMGNDGWLYGTTVAGGTNGFGTVFKVNDGGFVVLHSFTNSPDGANSYSSLALGCDGALYGVTDAGGATNAGTVFRINTDATGYSVLYQFTRDGDGSHPFAGLVSSGGNGVFYGTTLQGGTNGFGTVYRLALLPNLTIQTTSQSVPKITLSGVAGQPCQVQVSSNLLDWTAFTNLVLTNGTAQFTDPATNLQARFYRALIQ